MDNFNLIPSAVIKAVQKLERNLVSLSDTMVVGTPCNLIICLINKCAEVTAVVVVVIGIKCAILENRSTTVKIPVFLLFVSGRDSIKSIDISCQGFVASGSGDNLPGLR